jgi:sucrose phosphorylase
MDTAGRRVRNQPQLITYADRFAGDLLGVLQMLDGPLAGAFGGVHVLPFYVPIDGSDAGFDPSDHTSVDPRVGTWDDVRAIAEHYDVMADIIVNHMSDAAAQFRDWLARGDASPHADLFLTMTSVFGKAASEADLAKIYRPRPGMPFTKVALADGTARLAWTTFTSQQIDIDVTSPSGRAYLDSIVERLEAAGVTLVRLDAIGYAIKKRGTSCFMIPETFAFIDDFADRCRRAGMTVLVEIHGYHRAQIEIAERVDMVYDFALPPLVLDAIYRRDSGPLEEWLRIRPTNTITVLDTHDGIGIVDVAADPYDPDRPGLLPEDRIAALVSEIHKRSGETSRLATGAAASNLDIYQVNCTFYDALGADDRAYLIARLVQMVVPGIPQVYYVGLLAGRNDTELLDRTGVGRDINRHHYSPWELNEALARPVVQRLLALLRWRGAHPAFDGTFELLEAPTDHLRVRWTGADESAGTIEVDIDLAELTAKITERDPHGERRIVAPDGLDDL